MDRLQQLEALKISLEQKLAAVNAEIAAELVIWRADGESTASFGAPVFQYDVGPGLDQGRLP